eukprot:TRINITY_DN18817_c0_g1_i1.p1 TRINITY_DN18817_c0_g1~~TRINITY_DN18817_c0_g1_i1.p1  ORF type:complete len:382 (+),score=62.15 TRINITY_DN18817_c0_g1_i1:545-1690(+)
MVAPEREFNMANGPPAQQGTDQKRSNRPHAMAGGDGQYSYDQNSSYQRQLFETARPLLTAALNRYQIPNQSMLHVADLGCSTGKNSISQTGVLLSCLRAAGKLSTDTEIMVSFSDLPDNDFNLLLKRASEARQRDQASAFFAAAVPGSFYEALFPKSWLHMVTCNTALHWMSRVPLESERPYWNPGTIWYSRTQHQHVKDAYQKQGLKDLSDFLGHRGRELVPGGFLWMYIPGPGGREELPRAGYEGNTWIDIIDDAWRDLVREGVLEQESLDTFNMPVYYPSVKEIAALVESAGCYTIDTLQYVESELSPDLRATTDEERERAGVKQAGLVWAVVKSLVTGALGGEKAERLFERMQRNAVPKLERYLTPKMYTCVALIRK